MRLIFWAARCSLSLRRSAPPPCGPWTHTGRSTLPAGQESVDQVPQVVAIAAFQDGCGGKASFVQPAAEGGKIFAFERHGGDRILRVSVETRGHKDELGLESDDGIEGL